jgi:hypothetical protein
MRPDLNDTLRFPDDCHPDCSAEHYQANRFRTGYNCLTSTIDPMRRHSLGAAFVFLRRGNSTVEYVAADHVKREEVTNELHGTTNTTQHAVPIGKPIPAARQQVRGFEGTATRDDAAAQNMGMVSPRRRDQLPAGEAPDTVCDRTGCGALHVF